jgi:gliding motility-associated-like protein
MIQPVPTMKKTLSRLFYFSFLLISMHLSSQAQNCVALPTGYVAGGFNVSPAIGCVGQPVTVTSLIPTATKVRYIYNFKTFADTTTAATTNTTFTYTAAGRYLIVQIGTMAGKRVYSCQAINITATPAFTFTVTSCGNGTVRLSVNNTVTLPYTAYTINWGDGTGTQVWTPTQPALVHTYARVQAYNVNVVGQIVGSTCTTTAAPRMVTPTGTPPAIPTWVSADVIDATTVEMVFQTTTAVAASTYTLQQRIYPSTTGTNVAAPNYTTVGTNQTRARVTGLNTATNTYMYVLNINSQCAGSNISIASQDIGIVSLTAAPQPYQTLLTWRPFASPGLVNFQVLRDGVLIATLPATQYNYTDQKVVCGQKYSYQVVAIYNRTPAAKSSSRKLEVTTLPTTLPPTLTNVWVNVRDENSASVNISLPTTNTTRIAEFRVTNGNRVILGTKTLINDSLAKPYEKSECYTVNYIDACGRSPKDSVVVCTILAEARGEILKWSEASPLTGKISGYTIERLDNLNRVTRTYNASLNTEWVMDITDTNQEVVYRVRGRSTTGSTAVSNIVKAYRPMKVYVPDAFSPNGDKINEVFTIKGVFIKDATLTIFNRAGRPVFFTEDWKTGWNGTIDGQAAASGWYTYLIEARDLKDTKEVIQGALQLIR